MRLKVTPLAYVVNGIWKASWFVTKIYSDGEIKRVAEFEDFYECLQYCSNSGYVIEMDERIFN